MVDFQSLGDFSFVELVGKTVGINHLALPSANLLNSIAVGKCSCSPMPASVSTNYVALE